jgi:hypothetical protein
MYNDHDIVYFLWHRSIMLYTIPILILSLMILISPKFNPQCSNNTQRLGCISICSLTYWICTLIITSLFPFLLQILGLTGVFGLFVVGCIVSWIFVYLKVPETKGMPLEVIILSSLLLVQNQLKLLTEQKVSIAMKHVHSSD